jgi:hypothetical protein
MHAFDDFMLKIIREKSIFVQQKDCLINNINLRVSKFLKKEKKKIKSLPVIQYIRYFKESLVGIVGSKEFALNIQKSIILFFKSDLHFNINNSTISSQYEKGILFCNYYIYCGSVKRKIMENCRLVSLKKYKQRLLSKFKVSDARLARCLSYQMKKNFIVALQQELGSLKINKDSLKEVTQNMVKKIKYKEIIPNKALERYIRHYKRLSDYNL